MRLKYFYLPIIVGLVNEELLSTGGGAMLIPAVLVTSQGWWP